MLKKYFRLLAALTIVLAPVGLVVEPALADDNAQLVSMDPQGNKAEARVTEISRDGRYVLFGTDNSQDKGKLYLRDLSTGITKLVSTDSNNQPFDIHNSDLNTARLANHKVFFMTGSGNNSRIYEKDLTTGELKVVNLDAAQHSITTYGTFSVSGEGNIVVWAQANPDGQTFTLYVRNISSSSVSTFSSPRSSPLISGNGQYLFYAQGTSYNDSHVYKRNLQTGVEEVTPNAVLGEGVQVSDDGKYLATSSSDGVFKYDTVDNTTQVMDVHGNDYCAISNYFSLSGDGSTMVFSSARAVSGGCNSTYYFYVQTTSEESSRLLGVNDYGNLYDNFAFANVDGLSYDGSLVTFISSASNAGVMNPGMNLGYVRSTASTAPTQTDTVNPSATDLQLQNTTKQSGDTDTVTMNAADDNSGVVTGEFFLQDNNQVQPSFATVIGFPDELYKGFGTPMSYNNGLLTGSIGSDVPDGSYTVFARAQDTAGNWSDLASTQLTVEGGVYQDSVPPAPGSFNWTNNPKTLAQSATLTVPVTDDSSGVAGGEYFIGDTDPGVGNGATMTLGNVQNGGLNADLTTSFGTNFQPGVYKISVRAEDSAGNWSAPVSDYLVVYDSSSSLKFTGKNKKDLLPTLSNGDILPGLTTANQIDTADYGFTVAYKNGVLDSHNDFQFSYNTGKNCGKPTAQNCHSFSLNANSFAWLVADQNNNSRGRFQGTAAITVDGVTTTSLFTVEGIDGDRLTPSTNDTLVLKVYAPGANPSTATPIYQASGSMVKGASVKIQ